MNRNVIITYALTGAGDTVGKNPHVPVTPEQIAAAAAEAAKAGATIVHCHERDPKTGKGSRDTALYAEVMGRIRESGIDIIVNLTAGMGGDLEIGPGESPTRFGPGTDLVGPLARLVHVEALLPDICTLDCGTLNFGDGDTIYVSTPAALRTVADRAPHGRPGSGALGPGQSGRRTAGPGAGCAGSGAADRRCGAAGHYSAAAGAARHRAPVGAGRFPVAAFRQAGSLRHQATLR